MTNEQLVARIQDHENEAENMLALWHQNKGFIHKMAIKYIEFAELEDLKQECYIGLCHAVQHYNADQDASFIHYAAFWMKQVMLRYIDNCCSSVRIPVHARSEIHQYKKIYGEYRKYYGKEPTEFEMRYFLGVSTEKLESIKKNVLATQIRSLDECVGGENDDIMLGDSIPSEQDMEEDIIRKLDAEIMAQALWEAVDNLPGKQGDIIRKRYQERMTLNEVGKSMGVSLESVRQEETKGMRTLRKRKTKNEKFRCYFEQYIAPSTFQHVGLAKFNRTWTSSVEAEVLGW